MYSTDTDEQKLLIKQADDLQRKIKELERRARKASTASEKLKIDSEAQVLRKQRRSIMEQYYNIEN